MIEIKNLSKNYEGTEVLKDINLVINKGDIFGIVGQSGAGKSTLLRCLNGLIPYDSGVINIKNKEIKNFNQKEIRALRKDLGMVFQNFSLMSRKNVFENIALPLEIWGENKKNIKQRVEELVDLVGLSSKIDKYPSQLSGGEKQRVGIARALALKPEILLCDEATSALDPKTTKAILKLLNDINKKLNITIIMVTHQMEVIKEVCTKVALMENGKIVAAGKVEELFLKPSMELEKLLSEEELIPDSGSNIKLFFPKEFSNKTIITNMARELDIDFSIAWGKLEKFREDVLGSLIINVSKEHEKQIIEYLNRKNIGHEIINN